MSKENLRCKDNSLLNNLNLCLKFRSNSCFGLLTPLRIRSTPLFMGKSEDFLLPEEFDRVTTSPYF